MNLRGLIAASALCTFTCLSGCLKEHTSRLQMEEETDKPLVRTVGDVAEIQTAGGVPVSGVGLVVGLEGTGGGASPGPYRQMAEEYLKRNKIDNPKEWLESPHNALVLVSAEIPPGSRRGERVNIEITLPPGSRVKSLRGGYLLETSLSTYATQSQVRTRLEQTTDIKPVNTGDGLLKGHALVDAEGPLHVALKDRENSDREVGDKIEGGIKRAWVWKGGRTKSDQPFYLIMNPNEQRYRMAMTVADRINETFHGPGTADKIANARTKDTVVLTIPPQHRSNPAHFLRVARMIPVDRIDDGYRRKLEDQIAQPETCLSAALRMEALGRDTIPIMMNAVKNSPYPLVRFASAESLAYLGEPIAAQELAKLAEEHPSLQALCLTALASLDEAASSFALQELLASDQPEVRYGALRALRELDPRGDASRGLLMNKSFWLHPLAAKSKPLVHLLSGNRAEIAVFGEGAALVGPFSLRAGPDIILSAKAGESKCTISRFSLRKPERIEQSSLSIVEIVKTMAEMGALYEDVAQMLTQARDTKALTCDLAIDALPREVSIQKLAQNAHVDKKMENEAELLKSSAQEQAEPTSVFDRTSRR